MSREKAIMLISILGSSSEQVLSLLAEEHAYFLRENMKPIDTFNVLELESVASEVLAPTENVGESSLEAFDESHADEDISDISVLEDPVETLPSEDDSFDLSDDFSDVSSMDDFSDDMSLDTDSETLQNYQKVAELLEEQNPQLVVFS